MAAAAAAAAVVLRPMSAAIESAALLCDTTRSCCCWCCCCCCCCCCCWCRSIPISDLSECKLPNGLPVPALAEVMEDKGWLLVPDCCEDRWPAAPRLSDNADGDLLAAACLLRFAVKCASVRPGM
uniref:Putative secreted protein n=1 Tax=Anopheles triannulatus TaxID=58253 RepID=A0A2M4B5V4_9DIPT